eukprot:scaffold34388_cov67-Isochrysis_galbana.AAC.1
MTNPLAGNKTGTWARVKEGGLCAREGGGAGVCLAWALFLSWLWKGLCRFAELAGMLSGVAIAAPASSLCPSPRCELACSAKTLLRMVPELDQPRPAISPGDAPGRRWRRSQVTAVRTSSLAPLDRGGEGLGRR